MTARHGGRLRALLRRPAGRVRRREQGDRTPLARTGLLAAPVVPAGGRGAAWSETAGTGLLDTRADRREAAAVFGTGEHGVATAETLARIQAEAARQAEAERQATLNAAVLAAAAQPASDETAAWNKPEHLMRDGRDRSVRPNRPYSDPDPTTIDPETARWSPPVTAQESASRIARLTYPPPLTGTREQYAAMSRQVSAFTNTRSRAEQPSGWPPVFRSAEPDRPAIAWDPQRPPLLALPAASNGVAA